MNAKYARQIRVGIEAAMRGERRTDGAGTSLECRAFNRTIRRALDRRLSAMIIDIETRRALSEALYAKAQANAQALLEAATQNIAQEARRQQEILDLEYKLNYPHPTEDSVANAESFDHIVRCLYCRHQFSWLLEGQH